MRILAFGCIAALFLSGCSTAAQQQALVSGEQTVIADGQLVCKVATADGPIVLAVADMLGAPVLVTNMASSWVAGICAGLDAVPAPLPAGTTSISTVTVAPPPPVPASAVNPG